MAVITRTGVSFTDFFGRPVSKATQRVLWDPIMAEKAGYKHFMLKEIFEQPTAARETILGRVSQDTGQVFLEEMKITEAQLAAIERVTILACGTSWHAGLVGKFMIEQLARVPVEVDYGSEYRYRDPIVAPQHAGDRHHAVGRDRRHAGRAARGQAGGRGQHRHLQRRRQHGDARDRRHRLHARRAGDRRRVDQGLHVAARRALPARPAAGAGARRAVAEDSRPHVDALLQLPLLLEQTLKMAPELEEIAGAFSHADRLPLSRPRHQLPDRARRRAQAEGNLLHPRRRLSGRRDEARADRAHRRAHAGRRDRAARPVFEKMIGNMQEVKARGGSVIALTTRGDDKLRAILDPERDFVLEVPRTPPLLTPIVMVVPLQLLAYDIAVRRGCDVDQPRNLAKSVTVE